MSSMAQLRGPSTTDAGLLTRRGQVEHGYTPQHTDWRAHIDPDDHYGYLKDAINPHEPQHSMGFRAGNAFRNWVGRPGMQAWGSLAGRGPLVTGATAAGLGALLGLGGATIFNKFADPDRQISPKMLAILGALTAGGVGMYAGHNHSKYASWRSAELSKDDIRQILQLASDISASDKQQALSAIDRLTGAQMTQLRNILAATSGGALGLIIFRFLVGKGLIGTLASVAAGAIFGRNLAGAPARRNAFGQRTF